MDSAEKSRKTPATAPRTGLSRRRLLQLGGAAGLLAAGYYFGVVANTGRVTIKQSRPMMGTVVNLTVCGPDEDLCREAITRSAARMEELSEMMSSYRRESPLSRLNRHGILENAPAELLEVFRLSRELSELTDGAFDPTVKPLLALFREVKATGVLPPRQEVENALALVDYRRIVIRDGNTIVYTRPGMQCVLGGIAKGYIVDQGIELLREQDQLSGLIEAGGDLMTLGLRSDGSPWRIGIRNPRSDDLARMDTIPLSNRAIATSGDYLQYFTDDRRIHHIIDPRTGFSPLKTASSSILAPTVARADALATATMVLGPVRSRELVESLPDCEGYFFDKQLNKYQTSGFFS